MVFLKFNEVCSHYFNILIITIIAILGLLPLSFFTKDVYGQVVINEFSSSTSSDWVELYNNSDKSVDLSNYFLKDGSTSGNTKNLSCILSPFGYFSVSWSNSLNNAGDIIKLIKSDDIVDCVSYGNGTICEGETQVHLELIGTGQYAARIPDGVGGWTITSDQTKDLPNDGTPKTGEENCLTQTTPTISAIEGTDRDRKKATYKINEVFDDKGNKLSNVKIYINGVYTHNYAPETYTFCPSCKCEKCEVEVLLISGNFSFRLDKSGYETLTYTIYVNYGQEYEKNPILKVLDLNDDLAPTEKPTKFETQQKNSVLGSVSELSDEKPGENEVNDGELILGTQDTQNISDNSDPARSDDESNNTKLPVGVYGLIIGGVILMIGAGYPIFSRIKLLNALKLRNRFFKDD